MHLYWGNERSLQWSIGQDIPSVLWVHRAECPDDIQSYDFVYDQTVDARALECLTVVDEFTRQGVRIESVRSLMAGDLKRERTELELIAQHGPPGCLRSNNGPELISVAVKDWLAENAIDTDFIDLGSPWQNADNESFNSIVRTTCLSRWAFESISGARRVIASWLGEYNTLRPHGSPGGRRPNSSRIGTTPFHENRRRNRFPNFQCGPKNLG